MKYKNYSYVLTIIFLYIFTFHFYLICEDNNAPKKKGVMIIQISSPRNISNRFNEKPSSANESQNANTMFNQSNSQSLDKETEDILGSIMKNVVNNIEELTKTISNSVQGGIGANASGDNSFYDKTNTGMLNIQHPQSYNCVQGNMMNIQKPGAKGKNS